MPATLICSSHREGKAWKRMGCSVECKFKFESKKILLFSFGVVYRRFIAQFRLRGVGFTTSRVVCITTSCKDVSSSEYLRVWKLKLEASDSPVQLTCTSIKRPIIGCPPIKKTFEVILMHFTVPLFVSGRRCWPFFFQCEAGIIFHARILGMWYQLEPGELVRLRSI